MYFINDGGAIFVFETFKKVFKIKYKVTVIDKTVGEYVQLIK